MRTEHFFIGVGFKHRSERSSNIGDSIPRNFTFKIAGAAGVAMVDEEGEEHAYLQARVKAANLGGTYLERALLDVGAKHARPAAKLGGFPGVNQFAP